MPDSEINKKLIVLIEDEMIVLNLLTQKLEKAGYLVKTATDGEAGLALIQETEPDLVLLDMMLPKLNGFSVLEKMVELKLLPKIPVVIISNSGQPIEIERAQKLGIRDYLIKVNFNPNEVLAKVNQVLELEETSPSPSSLEEGASHGRKIMNVLIVEDDLFMVSLLEKKFSPEEYHILKASNVTQAREILGSSKIDLMLLDVVLPGTDGFTFLKELKQNEKYNNIPVIITSNLGQQEEIDKGIKEGASDYIVKAHSTPGEIVEKVEKILKSSK
ncbi:MAG: response regulator [Parcubacteria group bacterium]|jgi:DNA-binding response OmpR family regulator